MRMRIDPYRSWKDPNKLTPYEEKIWALLQEGRTVKEVGIALGGRSEASLRATVAVIKDKKRIYGATG